MPQFAMASSPRVRKDINTLSQDELSLLLKAWKGIQDKDPNDDYSFFKIAGYHGMPFRGAGWGNSQWWGGYCHHGNILFPTWHRAYVYRLEEALRKIPGCENVTMPYWNEPKNADPTNPNAIVIPEIFTQQTIPNPWGPGDIPNPLYSYTFQQGVTDNISTIDPQNPYDYSKPGDILKAKGIKYTTVRYPQSGLVGTEKDLEATIKQNTLYGDPIKNATYLNGNIWTWLTQKTFVNSDGKTVNAGVSAKFSDCLQAPNYTVFSNTTSATEWNNNRSDTDPVVVPLESPHNDIHLAVGGFEVPGFNANAIAGAQGDMGENDTAGFDPIFFFHHCWIDNVFWQWQVKHDADIGSKTKLSITDAYPGTNSVDSQGPTPGVAGGSWLSLDTALQPFKKTDGEYYVSTDLVNIETQLGYTYDNTLPQRGTDGLLHSIPSAPVIAHISGLNKRDVRGSFTVGVFGTLPDTNDGKEQLLGSESVLSRWHMEGCGNCQLHTAVKRYIPLHGVTHAHVNAGMKPRVEVFTRDGGVKEGVTLHPQLKIIKKL